MALWLRVGNRPGGGFKFGVVQAIGDIRQRRPLHRQRNRPDDVSRRVEVFPDARHPAQSGRNPARSIGRRNRRPRPTTAPAPAIFPKSAGYARGRRAPSSRMRRQASTNSRRCADAAFVAPRAETIPARASDRNNHGQLSREPLAAALRAPAASISSRHCPPSPVSRQRRPQPPRDFHRPLGGEMARVKLQWNVACREFIANAVVANRIVDRKVGRALGRDDPAHGPVTLANPRTCAWRWRWRGCCAGFRRPEAAAARCHIRRSARAR